MGLFEKVKNMFTEEVEDDDVKVEKIKKEVTKVEIESPQAIKEEKDNEEEENFEFDYKEKENKPVFFDDNDFRDLNLSYTEEEKPLKREKEIDLYGGNSSRVEEVKVEKKIFKPTPIISPVYGVLDKNYHKEDIVSKNDTVKTNEPEKEPSIDTIRNKAYGTLEDELENTLFGTNSILFKKDSLDEEKEDKIEEISEESLTNFTDDISKELDELLTDKVSSSKEVDDSENTDDDLLGFIDSTLYKNGDDE